MNAETLKKELENKVELYYGKGKIKIFNYYDIFEFAEVAFYDSLESIFVLPISVISREISDEKHINLNKLYDFSSF